MTKLIRLFLLLLFSVNCAAQKLPTGCILTLDTKNILLDRQNAVIKLKTLDKNGTFVTIKEIQPVKSTIVISIKANDPYMPWVELWEKASLIAQSDVFILTNCKLKVVLNRLPGKTAVIGGENKFYEENRWLFLAKPHILADSPDYSSDLAKRFYDLAIPNNYLLKILYEEYERNVFKYYSIKTCIILCIN